MAGHQHGEHDLVRTAWTVLGHLRSLEQSLRGLLDSNELALNPGAEAVVSDTARRLEYVIAGLNDELDRADRADPPLVRSILAWGGRVVGRLAAVEGAIAGAERLGPILLTSAAVLGQLFVDLDLGVPPTELWLPALANQAIGEQEGIDEQDVASGVASEPPTATPEEFDREGRGAAAVSPEDQALLDQVPEGMQVVTDEGEIVTYQGEPVVVPIEGSWPGERRDPPTARTDTDENGRHFQVDPVIDDGPVGEPRLGTLEEFAAQDQASPSDLRPDDEWSPPPHQS